MSGNDVRRTSRTEERETQESRLAYARTAISLLNALQESSDGGVDPFLYHLATEPFERPPCWPEEGTAGRLFRLRTQPSRQAFSKSLGVSAFWQTKGLLV